MISAKAKLIDSLNAQGRWADVDDVLMGWPEGLVENRYYTDYGSALIGARAGSDIETEAQISDFIMQCYLEQRLFSHVWVTPLLDAWLWMKAQKTFDGRI